MTKQMKTKEVIELIQAGGTVKDIVLSDLESQILGFRDALLLVETAMLYLLATLNMMTRK
jgi:hypothetical protein